MQRSNLYKNISDRLGGRNEKVNLKKFQEQENQEESQNSQSAAVWVIIQAIYQLRKQVITKAYSLNQQLKWDLILHFELKILNNRKAPFIRHNQQSTITQATQDYQYNRREQQHKKIDREENLSMNYIDDDSAYANKPLCLMPKKFLPNQYNLVIHVDKMEIVVSRFQLLMMNISTYLLCKHFLNNKIKNQNTLLMDKKQQINQKIKQIIHVKNAIQIGKLVFLDINMPIKDGIQTVREIKQIVSDFNLQNVCCAANSAFSDIETKQKAYEAGMDFYLTKPLNLPILKQLIQDKLL